MTPLDQTVSVSWPKIWLWTKYPLIGWGGVRAPYLRHMHPKGDIPFDNAYLTHASSLARYVVESFAVARSVRIKELQIRHRYR